MPVFSHLHQLAPGGSARLGNANTSSPVEKHFVPPPFFCAVCQPVVSLYLPCDSSSAGPLPAWRHTEPTTESRAVTLKDVTFHQILCHCERYQLPDWRIQPLLDEMCVPTRRHPFPSLHKRQRAKRPRGASPISRAGSPMAIDTFVRKVLSEIAPREYSPDPYDAEGGTEFNGCDTLARR
ncbi:hypothetical protein EDB83DRAFT_1576845 [Lactarius deliciosus]|nr:hypothetical protein EDB83DRAFT_1576845 [Lactarius deliciosus]